MRKSVAIFLIGSFLLAMFLVGCGNKPSEKELNQLNDLKEEVGSLEKAVMARENDKAALLKSIAEKDAQAQQCAKDKAAIQERLKSGK